MILFSLFLIYASLNVVFSSSKLLYMSLDLGYLCFYLFSYFYFLRFRVDLVLEVLEKITINKKLERNKVTLKHKNYDSLKEIETFCGWQSL